MTQREKFPEEITKVEGNNSRGSLCVRRGNTNFPEDRAKREKKRLSKSVIIHEEKLAESSEIPGR